jgi:hypothetical protein
MYYNDVVFCTVPKIWQISVSKEEEFPCREDFPVILGNQSPFPRITGKFSLQGTSSLIFSEICLVFGTVCQHVCSGGKGRGFTGWNINVPG